MLRRIRIKNIALIQSLELELEKGLCTLTGETGAGKSILIDSLKLALGGKAERDLIRTDAQKAYVEAEFDCPAGTENLLKLEELGIEPDNGLILLSRELSINGRSVSRINGVLVNLSVVREVAPMLIDIYGQHEYQSLMNTESHLDFLDSSITDDNFKELLGKAEKTYDELQHMRKGLNKGISDPKERERKIDSLLVEIGEIDNAKLKIGEEELLLKKRDRLLSIEEITDALDTAIEQSGVAYDAAVEAADAVESISEYDETYAELQKSLREASIILEDVRPTLRKLFDSVEADGDDLDKTETRLKEIYSLERKYGKDIDEILAYKNDAEIQLNQLRSQSEEMDILRKKIHVKTDEYYEIAKSISEIRRIQAETLKNKLLNQLSDLGMNKTCLDIQFRDFPKRNALKGLATKKGLDKIEIMISPNPGIPLGHLSKIASGGELSRIMLALKAAGSETFGVECMIFDEVDTGLGGSTAWTVAQKLSSISKNRQVLCITHQPQVAAMADCNLLVEKLQEENTTYSSVKKLNDIEIINEIARMSGGDQDVYIEHAEALRKQANELKE